MNQDCCFYCTNPVSEEDFQKPVKIVNIRDKIVRFRDLCQCLSLVIMGKEVERYPSMPHLTLVEMIEKGFKEIDEELQKL